MREILFQIWDKEKKRMSKPLPVFHPFIEWSDGDIEMPTDFALSRNERFIFREYTGLKDKDGVDIYEGDILKRSHDRKANFHAVIEFNSSGFAGATYPSRNHVIAISRLGSCDYDGKGYDKIVGNIYENPELIECQLPTHA